MNVGQLDWSRLDLGTEWEGKGISVVSVDSRATIPASTGVRNAREQQGPTPSWLACHISAAARRGRRWRLPSRFLQIVFPADGADRDAVFTVWSAVLQQMQLVSSRATDHRLTTDCECQSTSAHGRHQVPPTRPPCGLSSSRGGLQQPQCPLTLLLAHPEHCSCRQGTFMV